MTQFASRVVNTDPNPYAERAGVTVFAPRPEYTLFPSNPINPILLAYRNHLARYQLTEAADEWLFALSALKAFGGFVGWDATRDVYHSLTVATDEQIDHAEKVLVRLASVPQND